MKINVPLSNLNELKSLIKNGADELYCGVLTPQWKEKYSSLVSPNIESYPEYNLKNYEELKKAIKIAHLNDVKLFLTLNSINYTKQQYLKVTEFAKKADKWGVDGFIVANMGLCFYLKKITNPNKLYLSIKGGVFNSNTIKFLYKETGILRMMLPQQISIREIEQICKSKPKQAELSSFIIMGICSHCQSLCTFIHGIDAFKSPAFSAWLFKTKLRKTLIKTFFAFKRLSRFVVDNSSLGDRAACSLNYNVIPSINNDKKARHTEKQIQHNLEFKTLWRCNVCALYRLNRLGVKSIKIEGRGTSTESKIEHLKFLKGLLNKIDHIKSEKEFIKKAKKQFNQIYGQRCEKPINCYYKHINGSR